MDVPLYTQHGLCESHRLCVRPRVAHEPDPVASPWRTAREVSRIILNCHAVELHCSLLRAAHVPVDAESPGRRRRRLDALVHPFGDTSSTSFVTQQLLRQGLDGVSLLFPATEHSNVKDGNDGQSYLWLRFLKRRTSLHYA